MPAVPTIHRDLHGVPQTGAADDVPTSRATAGAVTNTTDLVVHVSPDRELKFMTTEGVDLLKKLRSMGLGLIHEACRPRV